MKSISVLDSHTGGEPTRIVIGNGPNLGNGTIAEQAAIFDSQFQHIRSAVIAEPRGSDVYVGGILCEPTTVASVAGIIFFDNDGLLGMCGHGTMGLAVTLHYLGKIDLGEHQIETPVGNVAFELLSPNRVRIQNVQSYRTVKDLKLEIDGFGTVTGDIAWGGNWFFLTNDCPCELEVANENALLEFSKTVRNRLKQLGHTGDNGEPIRHVEIHGSARSEKSSARNFVLCPGGAYDRSPCGTGTSAKLACLAADGKLQPGETWTQESIVGSTFEAKYRWEAEKIVPELTGSAYICGENKLILDENDPLCHGIVK